MMLGMVEVDADGRTTITAITEPPRCPFSEWPSPHDFDAHAIDGVVVQLHCRRCGLILPTEKDLDGAG